MFAKHYKFAVFWKYGGRENHGPKNFDSPLPTIFPSLGGSLLMRVLRHLINGLHINLLDGQQLKLLRRLLRIKLLRLHRIKLPQFVRTIKLHFTARAPGTFQLLESALGVFKSAFQKSNQISNQIKRSKIMSNQIMIKSNHARFWSNHQIKSSNQIV